MLEGFEESLLSKSMKGIEAAILSINYNEMQYNVE